MKKHKNIYNMNKIKVNNLNNFESENGNDWNMYLKDKKNKTQIYHLKIIKN